MDLKEMYREIVNEHNLHPTHKHALDNPTLELRGVNPSCGDDITLQLMVENDMITDGAYVGQGCAISQASADMMLDLVIGKSKDEALKVADIFMRMIKNEASEEEIESLDEAAALQNISHMPARVKCAQLGWRTMDEIIKGTEN
ncbi:MAG: SUF system NifU family Fe-S cluster assembly protein [Acetatifactor sp.]|nr:SUF system NifU family Fe-S cluster assembly protein [Acetatifactor sp.]